MPSRTEIPLTDDDVRNIPTSAWRLVRQNEAMRYWEADVELPGGSQGTVARTEYLESDQLLSMNADLRKERSGQRYTAGMGSDKSGNMPMVHTGQIPLNVYYQEIAPRIAAGDRDFLRWWLRQDRNAHFRTRDGSLRT